MAKNLRNSLKASSITTILSNSSIDASDTPEVKKAQKQQGIVKKQNLLTVRLDADMYEAFSVYCEIMDTNMSKEIKRFIKNTILNNRGIINNNLK